VFLTGAPVCCRFPVHPRSYNCTFTVFVTLLCQCVVNIILTTIGSCGERICQRDWSSCEQFIPLLQRRFGAHPLHRKKTTSDLHRLQRSRFVQDIFMI